MSMQQIEQSLKRRESKVSPLVLPHEFYGHNRKQTIEFRKDLSYHVTKSFAQRHAEFPTNSRNQDILTIKKMHRKEELRSSLTRRQKLKPKRTEAHIDCISLD